MLYLLVFLMTFFTNDIPANWKVDFEEAKISAQSENKQILMIFSGSDWCVPCKKLKKSILVQEEFHSFEEEHLVILYLDFPMKKRNKLTKEQTKHNEALADKFNRSGSFPNVILMDKEGNMVKKIPFENQSIENFIQEIKGE